MATHSSILAWRIPWTAKPGGLWSIESQKSDMTEVTSHPASIPKSESQVWKLLICNTVSGCCRCFLLLFFYLNFFQLYSFEGGVLFFTLFTLAELYGMQDVSSPTRIEPMPTAVEVWSPNHWTTREIPIDVLEEVKIRQGLMKMCCEHLWAWFWRMDRRGKAVSVKKGPPELCASFVYPLLPTISPWDQVRTQWMREWVMCVWVYACLFRRQWET